jgi:hypothetical protein
VTERLYLRDAYLREFDATVVEADAEGMRVALAASEIRVVSSWASCLLVQSDCTRRLCEPSGAI